MKITNLPSFILALVFLSACTSGSDSSSDPTNTTPTVYQPPVTNTNPPAVNNNVLRLFTHYSLLLGQPHIWNESGGVNNLNISQYASAGSSSIELNSASGLIQRQLITYKGRDELFYTAQIQSIQNNTLQLSTPLQQDVYAGSNAWNFYDDGSHPNWAGAFSIADFSINTLGWSRLNQGKHVLLGDSWFSRNSLFERLRTRLPSASFSNKGVGGDTAKNLLERFDTDVSWQNPSFVWILTGTNDYWQDVSAANYKSNMRQIINRVRDLGAIPIVFDSSVGPLHYGSDWKTILSRSYVTSMDQLVAEY